MGWCSGSYMAEAIWLKVRQFIPEDQREAIANVVYDVFCDGDADCWENSMTIIQDGGLVEEDDDFHPYPITSGT